jgi:hypothetical protein
MDEKVFEEDVKKAMRDLDKKDLIEATKHHEEKKRNPFLYILVVALALLIILMVIPYESIRLDPEPKDIPALADVAPANLAELRNISGPVKSEVRANYARMMFPENQEMRNMASKIATTSCDGHPVCYAKAMLQFVQKDLEYVSDPPNGYLENPFETLYQGGAYCDGLSVLLANLLSAVGLPVRFVFIPNHVFVQVKIDEAPRTYKESDGWISLDPACSYCALGELSYSTRNQVKEFLYV